MPTTSPPQATIIISVYKDTEALAVILHALQQQSTESFSILFAFSAS